MLRVYIDGACKPTNPGGTAAWGFLVQRVAISTDYALELTRHFGTIGSGPKMSNNVGEYTALLRFLQWFDKQEPELVEVRSDSQLVVNQIQGLWKVGRDKLFYPYYCQVVAVLVQNAVHWKDLVTYKWIPGESNLAHALTVEALRLVGIN